MKTVVAQARGELAVNKRRLTRAFSADEDANSPRKEPPRYATPPARRRVTTRHNRFRPS